MTPFTQAAFEDAVRRCDEWPKQTEVRHEDMEAHLSGASKLVQHYINDLGTVLFDFEKIEDERHRAFVMAECAGGGPVFSGESQWRMPHLLRQAGLFKSASDAARNGWDKDIPEGVAVHKVRARSGVKGVLITWRIPAATLRAGWWESCEAAE